MIELNSVNVYVEFHDKVDWMTQGEMHASELAALTSTQHLS